MNMNRTIRNRLDEVTRHLDEMPIAPGVEDAAFARFRGTGDLPDDRRLAVALVQRVLQREVRPPKTLAEVTYWANRLRELASASEGGEPLPPRPPDLRRHIFHEAVDESKCVRLAARTAIRMLVAAGRDVTDPDFVDPSVEMPDIGTVGLHLLGWPECLLRPPYVRQAMRLLDRLARLRRRIGEANDAWFEDLAAAIREFLAHGDLPADELLRDAVLAEGEMYGLMEHYGGAGDGELMAAFDAAARAKGEEQVTAIAKVQELVRDGRLFGGDE